MSDILRSSESIWKRRSDAERARQRKMTEAMADYDTNTYYPLMAEIRKDCEVEGHVRGKYHDNGFGWSWFYCAKCGGRYDITGPDGEKEDE